MGDGTWTVGCGGVGDGELGDDDGSLVMNDDDNDCEDDQRSELVARLIL